jgi:hypothetical protein
MPYSISIDHGQRRVEVIGQDPFGLDDVLQLMDRQVAEGAWAYVLLHDARSITWIPSVTDIRRLVSRVEANIRTHGPRGPVAIITTNEALFGMSRMYSVLGEKAEFTVAVFRDPLLAERWIEARFPHQV